MTLPTTAGARTADEQLDALKSALDERGLFSNPDDLDRAADKIDCGEECQCVTRDWDTGAAWCRKSDDGEYCPNDVAETLRAVAKVARAALSTPGGDALQNREGV